MVPAVNCFTSMLPPFLRGGIVLCPPGSSSAVPITPGKGARARRYPDPCGRGSIAHIPDLKERLGEVCLGQQTAPGRMAVHPVGSRLHVQDVDREDVARLRTRTTGPVRGWPRNGPRFRTSAWVDCRGRGCRRRHGSRRPPCPPGRSRAAGRGVVPLVVGHAAIEVVGASHVPSATPPARSRRPCPSPSARPRRA